MHRPAAFAVDDAARLDAFVDAHPFALLVSAGADVPTITHVPVLREDEALVCHLSRANPHCALLAAGARSKVVFTGPHGYVSPRWYAAPEAVPTWNYSAVHVTVTPEEITDPGALRRGMDAMVARFEPDPAIGTLVTPETVTRMLSGIRGFRLRVRECAGVFKLSQNRSAADRAGVVRALADRGGEDAALAAFMRAELPSSPCGHEPAHPVP